MHFSIATFWDPPEAFLRTSNPTFHNCRTTGEWDNHTNQTGAWWPCLDPLIFNPSDLDADAWMADAQASDTCFFEKQNLTCLTCVGVGGRSHPAHVAADVTDPPGSCSHLTADEKNVPSSPRPVGDIMFTVGSR